MPDHHTPADKNPHPPRAGAFEDLQRALDPHRDEEREGVEAEARARLHGRGVLLIGNETAGDMADLLDAVDRFDGAVEAHGGDLFVDTPTALRADQVPQPDNPAFVLPTRSRHEPVSTYISRVDEATDRLR